MRKNMVSERGGGADKKKNKKKTVTFAVTRSTSVILCRQAVSVNDMFNPWYVGPMEV